MTDTNCQLATSPKSCPLDEREIALIQNISEGMPIRTAAIAAGYSEGSANGNIYRMMASPSFADRLAEAVRHMPDMRIAIAKARIPRLVKAEEKALAKLEEDPELLVKNPKLFEREYKLAGLLSDAPQAQVNVTVNVASFAAQLLEHSHGAPDARAQDKHRKQTVD